MRRIYDPCCAADLIVHRSRCFAGDRGESAFAHCVIGSLEYRPRASAPSEGHGAGAAPYLGGYLKPTPVIMTMQTEHFDAAAIERTLHEAGTEIVSAITGLSIDVLQQPARQNRSPETWSAAYEALDRHLEQSAQNARPIPALDTLLRRQRTAYSPAEHWPKMASIVDLAPQTQPATLISGNPAGNVAGYLASLWKQDVSVAVALAPAPFWPEAGADASYGSIYLATDYIENVTIPQLTAPIRIYSCRISVAGVARDLHVVQVPWPDFTALPGETLAHLARTVESLRAGRSIAVHCGAGLGRSGTFALAHSLVSNSQETTVRDVLVSFLLMRLQRRGCIENRYQFASVGEALR